MYQFALMTPILLFFWYPHRKHTTLFEWRWGILLIYVFKAVAGQTLSEYVTQKRMEYACELLTNSSLYIAEIARLVGYKNPGSFSAQCPVRPSFIQ